MNSQDIAEAEERRGMEKLAAEFGISYDELTQLEFEIEEDTDEEGVPYSLLVRFEDGNPPAILAKIINLLDNTVELDPFFFDGPDVADPVDD